MTAVSLVSAGGFYPPPGLHLGVATLGTVQVTIDERSEAIRAKFIAGAAEAMSL